MDPVYRQALRAEAARSSGELALLAMVDLVKCYEHVRHGLLWQEAQAVDYALAELRVAVRSYRWPRQLVLDGILGRVLFAQDGIVAGHSLATTDLKVYMVRALHQRAEAHPRPALNVFVDDLALDDVDDCPKRLASMLAHAAACRRTMRPSRSLSCSSRSRIWALSSS